MGTVTKADIVERVYTAAQGMSKKESADVVEAVFETIKDTLE
jgi:nucleoid DNA-binding protein